MRALSSFDAVYLHRDPVDMRKSLDGLSAIVRLGMEKPVDARYVFVFIGRSKDRVKILYWDRTGYAIWYKCPERARFPWPKIGESVVELSPQLLDFLLDGVDVFVKPHAAVEIAQRW